MKRHESLFALFGGPLAWFVQLNVVYALASQPCFRNGQLALAPPSPDWTWPVMIVVTFIACAVALLATLISWRAYARTGDEPTSEKRRVLEVGRGRTRFLALWGVVLGAGAAVATASTTVAFLVLPRCAG